ncbi:enoyl-CoA delta isomerase 2, peroxisomal-like [Papaver somniferum]|uniref:enoyl-CoA delta isomerase 2, peroxisomal-like n=1 Tax=Papaver somniferum TaxID=3469 RepID=UPI000E704C82|nr:enoyl-CoA delta isomerase 2, peroxisomal-like [Papaver somniferum]
MCSLEKSGDIFILTLTGDDEHRLTPTLIESIRISLKQVRTDAKPGSVLITTAQGKFFSNGFDLKYAAAAGSASGSYDRLRGMSDSFKFVVADLFSLPMPTVAAVSGHAAAAGFLLALSHDYVLMRKDKGILYMSELNIGLNFADYFMAFLKSKIPSSRVRRDVLLQSMKIRADKAVEMGLIDFAYNSVEETKEAALKLAVKLGSNN